MAELSPTFELAQQVAAEAAATRIQLTEETQAALAAARARALELTAEHGRVPGTRPVPTHASKRPIGAPIDYVAKKAKLSHGSAEEQRIHALVLCA